MEIQSFPPLTPEERADVLANQVVNQPDLRQRLERMKQFKHIEAYDIWDSCFTLEIEGQMFNYYQNS